MIHKRLGPANRVRVQPRRSLRELKFTPTFYRSPRTRHEPGLGGVEYTVTFVGDELGQVMSTWSLLDSVHWIAYRGGFIPDEADDTRPKAYPSRIAATNALLAAAGWEALPLGGTK